MLLLRRNGVAVVVALLAMTAILEACSSDDPASPVQDAGADVVETPEPQDDAAGGGACNPTAPLPRATKWTAPRPFQLGTCTAAQVSGYVQSCLIQADTPAICEAFKEKNLNCYECIDSNEEAPTSSALLWFRNRMYFGNNVPGCVANQLNDLTDKGCGAAEGRFEDCQRLACRGCASDRTKTARDALSKCLGAKEMSTVCATELAEINVACAGHVNPPPGDPTLPCFKIGNETLEDLTRRYLTMWCGPPPPVDAGSD